MLFLPFIFLIGITAPIGGSKPIKAGKTDPSGKDPTTVAPKAATTTEDCSAVEVPFNVKDWIFHLPTYAPTNLLTVERVNDPLVHYGNVEEHIKILNFLINENKKYFSESKTPYFKKYVKHYPMLIKKFYCSLVGGGRDIHDFKNIDAEIFYTYLTEHEGDWDWLNPANVKRHQVWSLDEKETVIDTILTDSQNRTIIGAAWEETFSMFPDLLEKIAIDIQSEDYSTANRIWVVPTSILPVSLITKRIPREGWVSKMSITSNDLLAIKKESMSIWERIGSFLRTRKL